MTILRTAPPIKSKRWPPSDPRIRCLQRIGRRGLAGACIEGILSSSAPFVAVMDSDLQHDENRPAPNCWLRSKRAAPISWSAAATPREEIPLSSRHRDAISRSATALARHLTRVDITDPMSGFFHDAPRPL